MSKVINALGFQLAWWLCILSVSHGMTPWALALCAGLALLHLAQTAERAADIQLALESWALGLVLDSTLQAAGVIRFHGDSMGPLSPFWLWALWALMGLTLRSSMAFLQTWPLFISALAGAVFGPLSYHAGAAFGAADWTPTPTHVVALALSWALALPLLVALARKTPPEPPAPSRT